MGKIKQFGKGPKFKKHDEKIFGKILLNKFIDFEKNLPLVSHCLIRVDTPEADQSFPGLSELGAEVTEFLVWTHRAPYKEILKNALFI